MKVLSTIKQAVITLVTSDSSQYPRGQAKYNDKVTNYTRLSPYGLVSNPPKGSWVLLLSSMAQSAVKFGIASDMLGRIKGLKEGECGLYNTKTTSYVLLKANGDVDVSADVINLNGDVVITGSSVKHNGKEIGESHGHTQGNDSDGDSEQPISGVT